MTYQLSRNLVSTLEPAWADTSTGQAMESAALRLADWAVDILRTIDKEEPARWRQTAPYLRSLLDGDQRLPTNEELLATPRPWARLVSATN